MFKKTVAILLLTLFLFNWVGYRLLTSLIEAGADNHLQAKLDDNDYDESQLVSVKTPVSHLSYYNIDPAFESIKCIIEIAGILY